MNTIEQTMPRAGSTAFSDRTMLAVFTGAIFTSAFLLFFVQPMFTKMVLPLLGGSPAVWSVAMVVFQGLLLAGYCYAHLSTKYLGLRRSTIAHLVLLTLTWLVLPIAVTSLMGEAPAEGQAGWLVGVFLLSVGLPFFSLAGNGPLLQAWFSQSGHRQAQDPYFLYAASNLGSFAALILYPVLFEPLLRLKTQSGLWSGGFAVLIALIGGVAYLLSQRAPVAVDTVEEASSEPAPTPARIARWVLLSALPSGLLVAVTAHLSTDVAAVPLLWVAPLALFLLTFVLIFRDKPLVPMGLLTKALPVLAVAVIYASVTNNLFFLLAIGLHCLFFFVATLVCHHELYALRPGARHLTQFYLYMSLGGVIGGLFCGLIAPFVFNSVLEYPILVILSLVALPGVAGASAKDWRDQALPVLAVAVVALIAVRPSVADPEGSMVRLAMFFALGSLLTPIALFRRPIGVMVALLALYGGTESFRRVVTTEVSERSFFGVHKISLSDNGRFRVLSHGTTVHGAMRLLRADGTPETGRPQPLTYYHPAGAINATLRAVYSKDMPGTGTPRQLGMIGLGTGAHACNSAPGDSWTFFEIDPLVIRIAQDPVRFRFLSECAPHARMVTGDARLQLVKEREGLFNYLLVDAFSSDSIPVHLMTREALSLYFAKLAPSGMLALHISNRHLELASVLGALAREMGVKAVMRHAPAGTEGSGYDAAAASIVVAMARSEETLAPLKAQGWAEIAPSEVAPWSDDFSNIVTAIWRNYTAAK